MDELLKGPDFKTDESFKMDKPRPKKPKTMNLQRVGWKAGLKRIGQQIKWIQMTRTSSQIDLN